MLPQGLLASARSRYIELLTAGVALRLGRALSEDRLGAVRVDTEAAAGELCGTLGLPGWLEGQVQGQDQAASEGGSGCL